MFIANHSEELEGKIHMATGNIFHKYVAREIREEFVKPEKRIPETPAKFTNPLAALTATFLEPVMKAIEVYLVSVRASFNVLTWRDPFLSFWTFSFLFVAMVFLALFPWRLFFCLVGLIGFGPQVSHSTLSSIIDALSLSLFSLLSRISF
jgi:hypothetical protein